MKKIISYILLLVMCVSLFAGCADNAEKPTDPTTEPTEQSTEPTVDASAEEALNSAKDYLYAMYKDAKTTTDADFTVVSQVRVANVTYPIIWSADKTDNVKIVSGENNMTTIEITAGAEDVNYKLTATLKNEQGMEVSVSFDHVIPAKAQVAGKTIVLANTIDGKTVYITGSHYLYTGKNKWQLNLTENEAEAIALEVIENSDDTVTFKAGDKYLFCDATHVKFADAQDDNTKFVLEAADTNGGFFIRCAVANYNGKAQYLEVYKGYLTSYGMGDPAIYTFTMPETSVAAGTISGLTENATPAPTTPAATNPTTPAPTTPTTPAPTTPSGGNNNNTSTGSKVVLSYPKENKYITGTQYTYTSSSSGKSKIELTLSDKKADAIALEKITNADGTVSFKAGNQYLYCNGTDVKFVTSQDDNTKFVLETTNGGYFIKCATANYNGNPQYLEVYSGYLTCYGMGADTSIYTFKLDNASGANGTITAPSGGNTGNSGNSGNSGNTGNTGTNNNTGTTVTINGKKAASIDMMGTTNLVSRTTSQTVYKANGITYTNDKASSQTDNYDQQGTYAARAYQSSTVKIEYTGMVAIVFTLDDFTDGKYLTGFDGMEVAGATITRNGDTVTITFAKATNVFQSAELLKQVRIENIDVYVAK